MMLHSDVAGLSLDTVVTGAMFLAFLALLVRPKRQGQDRTEVLGYAGLTMAALCMLLSSISTAEGIRHGLTIGALICAVLGLGALVVAMARRRRLQ